MLRFLYSIPDKIAGQGEDGVISYNYVATGLKYIMSWITFHHKDAHINKHDAARIG